MADSGHDPGPDTADTTRPARQAGLNLVTQVGLLLFGALLAAHLIAMALLQHTGTLIHPISREQALSTLAAGYALAHTDPEAALRSGLLTPGDSPSGPSRGVHLWRATTAEVGAFAMQPEERELEQELRQRLGLAASQPAWLQLERTSGHDARGPLLSLAAWQPLQLRASIALPEGSWLNARLALQGRYEWWPLLTYSLPASILPVLALALLLAVRLARPLRALISATTQVRYGRELPPLPLQGPREARELTRQFNGMQQRIARHRDARTRILAAISHDLRTPVTALRLQVELIDDDALRHDLLASVGELQLMLEETLDFARADSRAEPLRRIDVAELLQALAQRYASLGHTLRIDPQPLPPIAWTCRPLALKRALSNLIDNALHHAQHATLAVRHEAGTLVLRVDDDGPGVAPDLLEAVFEPFRQLDDTRGPERSGLGLGLSIARACVEIQGGTLHLSNRAPRGLSATITLPASP
ncbi:MAG: HAMP domain-containing sensor histidine kinase [Comamonas sp.]